MADIIDDANRYNELHQHVSLLNQRAKTLPETHPDFDGLHCIECGEEVEPARLKLSRVRCFSCQDLMERRAKQYAQ